MATYDLTESIPPISKLKPYDILDIPYSGDSINIQLPKGIYYLECWGAQGGYRSDTTYGGKGGQSVGFLTLNSKTDLYIYAGGSGNSVKAASNNVYAGGFNGGGYRYGYRGGGGASDIRLNEDSYYARVIVAGGGGSDGASSKYGLYGGGETGGVATESYGSYGYGGTQTGHSTDVTMPSTQYTTFTNSTSSWQGGFGFGGFGCTASSGYAGAGGGGWYGGCGSVPDGSGDDDRGGGGGSGYVYNALTAENYPSGCLLDSSYYLEDGETFSGETTFLSPDGVSETGHTGNGHVRIVVIKIENLYLPYVKIKGSWQSAEKSYVKVDGIWREIKAIEPNIMRKWKIKEE
jgi:hypothetical protein